MQRLLLREVEIQSSRSHFVALLKWRRQTRIYHQVQSRSSRVRLVILTEAYDLLFIPFSNTGYLYFVPRDPPERPAERVSQFIFFANDPSFVYTAFFADFGPLDLGITHQFCKQLQEAVQNAKDHRKTVLLFAGNHEHKKANSAVCLCAYLVCLVVFYCVFLLSLTSFTCRYLFLTIRSSKLIDLSLVRTISFIHLKFSSYWFWY